MAARSWDLLIGPLDASLVHQLAAAPTERQTSAAHNAARLAVARTGLDDPRVMTALVRKARAAASVAFALSDQNADAVYEAVHALGGEADPALTAALGQDTLPQR